MGARQPMQSSARKRYFRQRAKRRSRLVIIALILAGMIGGGLAYPVLAPDATRVTSDLDWATATQLMTNEIIVEEQPILPTVEHEIIEENTPTPEHEITETTTPTPETESLPSLILPTQGQIIPPSDDPQILYYTTAGDSLQGVSLRFGVSIDEINSPLEIDRKGFLPPGQLLIIPNRLQETSSSYKLLPDSEVTFSPSTVDFDIHAYVESAGGYLATHSQWLATTGITSGADVVERVARDYSVNPRLLLAVLEYQTGWVYGIPENQTQIQYPLGYEHESRRDLYLQLAWFASRVMDGYYGWKEGRRLVITFEDMGQMRLAPQLNAGSVGLMNAFTYLYDYEDWAYLLYGEENFLAFYEKMFGDPWIRALEFEPLIPPGIMQPEMILPFEPNITWAYTGGPHAAWSAADVWAALDFAPPSAEIGCHVSPHWVVASVSGLVVRSEHGVVVIDMDGDGFEQTGWTLLYLHIATQNRVPVGTWVEVGDRIGHPSCEGGRSTGTHVHIARRFNGEWVAADGPLPFVLSGWTARAATEPYKGWLIRDDDIVYASTAGHYLTHITREE